jgi:hypothetical protein
MMNLANLYLAVAEASFFFGMIIFTYGFGQVYDWWYTKKKSLMAYSLLEGFLEGCEV